MNTTPARLARRLIGVSLWLMAATDFTPTMNLDERQTPFRLAACRINATHHVPHRARLFQPERFFGPIRRLPAFSTLKERLIGPPQTTNLALPRAARLSILAALHQDLRKPFLLLTDRADHALTLLDELALWLPDSLRLYFPEPNPLFYENAPWGMTTRHDRLSVLSNLAVYHIPGSRKPTPPHIIIAPVRSVMARTLPRREFLKAFCNIKIGQVIQPEELLRTWVALGYEHANIVWRD